MRVRNGYWLVGRAGRWLGGLKAVRAGAEAQRRDGPGGLRGLGGLVSGAGACVHRCRSRSGDRQEQEEWEGGYQRTRLSRSSIACRTIRNTSPMSAGWSRSIVVVERAARARAQDLS
ncbi:MAG: hypothetical protein LC647_00645 [Beggiatoa sp.]|nr:hypothetical protein [Beggiatoa sp.]